MRGRVDWSTHFEKRFFLGTVLILSCFFLSEFREVPDVDPDCTPICEFRRTSSNFDNGPSIQPPVPINSWENFFVPLISFSLETFGINSSLTLEAFMSHDQLLLEWSYWLYLLSAANLFLFLSLFIWKRQLNSF